MTRKRKLAVLAAVIVLAIAAVALLRLRGGEEEPAQPPLTDSRVVESDAEQTYTAISYDNGQVNLSFARDEAGAWYWVDDPGFPLDGAYLEEMSQRIVDLHPMQTLTDADLETCGLAEPASSLRATAPDGKETVLLFGKTASDGSYYVKRADGEEVYVVSPELRQSMDKGIYQLAKLPELPALTGESLTAVRVKGPEQETKFAVKTGEDGRTVWRFGSVDVTEDETASAVASELAGLTFTACVDYRPSDEAVQLCGLNQPQATVTVWYLAANGTETTFKFSLGNLTAAGDGYYTRREGDTTIYSVDKDAVTALLAVARDGFAA